MSKRLVVLKMRGVFPPEKAQEMRPIVDALQEIVDRETPAITARLAALMEERFLHGEAQVGVTPRGLLT